MRATFEEAVAVQERYLTADALRARGVLTVLGECRRALAAVGWTPDELLRESEARALTRIQTLMRELHG